MCVSLIHYVLRDSESFFEWYNSHAPEFVSERQLVADLTNVRKALEEMGYVWP